MTIQHLLLCASVSAGLFMLVSINRTSDSEILKSMNNLALMLSHQGKYEAAEQMHQQMLDIAEKLLGPEHPETLMGINNFALALLYQGNYKRAKGMHQQALELKKKVLGPEHSSTLAGMGWCLCTRENIRRLRRYNSGH